MDDLFYYGMLAVFAYVAFQSLRNGHVLIGLLMVAIAGWVWYSHKENISYSELKQDIYQSIDEKAKRKYETGIRNQAFEYNTSETK